MVWDNGSFGGDVFKQRWVANVFVLLSKTLYLKDKGDICGCVSGSEARKNG